MTDHNTNIDFYLFIVKMLNSRVPQVYRIQIAFLFIINIPLLCAFINMNFAGITLYDSNLWPIAEIAKELGRIEHQYLSSPTSGDQKNLKGISVLMILCIEKDSMLFNILIWRVGKSCQDPYRCIEIGYLLRQTSILQTTTITFALPLTLCLTVRLMSKV